MTGVERIAAERQRHFDVEGWTPEHDDEHSNGEIAVAGACYAFLVGYPDDEAWKTSETRKPFGWPWSPEWWKPSDDPIRNLEKAGALIAAEIDRLQRLQERDV